MKNEEASARAQRRWKLLQQALTKQVLDRPTVQGYDLLQKQKPSTAIKVPDNCVVSCWTELEEIVLACQALDRTSVTVQLQDDDASTLVHTWTDHLPHGMARRDEGNLWTVEFDASNNHGEYTVVSYANGLLVRERTRLQVSLEELVGRRQVDNTGNICVWDCEPTLAWYLGQLLSCKQQAPPPSSVLELGAGMAGLAAWSCRSDERTTTIRWTDGNATCVLNNRINRRLMEWSSRSTMEHVHCHELMWSYEAPQEDWICDWTLVSDCTHFQEYHGELLWTLLSYARQRSYMCHPNRGNSLDRFLRLVQVVGEDHNEPLVRLEELKHPVIEEKHKKLLQEDDQYDPNLHYPRLFCLHKLRETTPDDLTRIQAHIAERCLTRA